MSGLILPRGFRKPSSFRADPSHYASRNLVGCWPFDGNPKGQIREVSAAGRHMPIIGTALVGPSHHGGFAFDTNGRTAYGLATIPFITYPLTLSVWCYFPTNPGTSDGYCPLQVCNKSANVSYSISFQKGASAFSTQIYAIDGGSVQRRLDIASIPSTGGWHHCVAVFQDANTFLYYLDGVPQSGSYALTGSPNPAGINGVAMGVYYYNSGSLFIPFSGYVEGGNVWNRALSAHEVAKFYLEPYAGLVPTYRAPFAKTLANTETGSAILGLSGISFAASGTDKRAGAGVLALSGISYAGAGIRKESGIGVLALRGISYAASGTIKHTGTGAMAFRGISIVAGGNDLGAPGSGLRQFWTF